MYPCCISSFSGLYHDGIQSDPPLRRASEAELHDSDGHMEFMFGVELAARKDEETHCHHIMICIIACYYIIIQSSSL